MFSCSELFFLNSCHGKRLAHKYTTAMVWMKENKNDFFFFLSLLFCVFSTCMLNEVTLIDWRFISNTDLFALRNLKIFQLSTHIHIKLGSMHSQSGRAEPSQALHVFDRLKRIFRKRCVLNKTNTVKSLIEKPHYNTNGVTVVVLCISFSLIL